VEVEDHASRVEVVVVLQHPDQEQLQHAGHRMSHIPLLKQTSGYAMWGAIREPQNP